jgi:hypothetical protein
VILSEANPEKIVAITNMQPPKLQKQIQKLTGCMAALSRFISRLGENGLLFFKLLKKLDSFKWTDDAQRALDELKTFLTNPPVLTAPRRAQGDLPSEELYLYLSCTTHVISSALVAERED